MQGSVLDSNVKVKALLELTGTIIVIKWDDVAGLSLRLYQQIVMSGSSILQVSSLSFLRTPIFDYNYGFVHHS